MDCALDEVGECFAAPVSAQQIYSAKNEQVKQQQQQTRSLRSKRSQPSCELGETRQIMASNISNVLQRGEKLDELVCQSVSLSAQSFKFNATAKKEAVHHKKRAFLFIVGGATTLWSLWGFICGVNFKIIASVTMSVLFVAFCLQAFLRTRVGRVAKGLAIVSSVWTWRAVKAVGRIGVFGGGLLARGVAQSIGWGYRRAHAWWRGPEVVCLSVDDRLMYRGTIPPKPSAASPPKLRALRGGVSPSSSLHEIDHALQLPRGYLSSLLDDAGLPSMGPQCEKAVHLAVACACTLVIDPMNAEAHEGLKAVHLEYGNLAETLELAPSWEAFVEKQRRA
eukprot:PhM_4_TR13888/c0_g1_i1/m.56549